MKHGNEKDAPAKSSRASVFGGLLVVLFMIGVLVCMAGPAAAVDTTSHLLDRATLQTTTGTAAITTTAADFTSWQPLVTIAPDPTNALWEGKVTVDLDKSSTGFGSTYTSGTITFSIARKVDGSNWRTATNKTTTALAGSSAGGLCVELDLGAVGPNEQVRIMVKVSAESNSNTSFPVVIYYRSGAKATITLAS